MSIYFLGENMSYSGVFIKNEFSSFFFPWKVQRYFWFSYFYEFFNNFTSIFQLRKNAILYQTKFQMWAFFENTIIFINFHFSLKKWIYFYVINFRFLIKFFIGVWVTFYYHCIANKFIHTWYYRIPNRTSDDCLRT